VIERSYFQKVLPLNSFTNHILVRVMKVALLQFYSPYRKSLDQFDCKKSRSFKKCICQLQWSRIELQVNHDGELNV